MNNLIAEQEFLKVLQELHHNYLPSKHRFFRALSAQSQNKIHSPSFLKDFYIRYQSMCHATRVMVYFLPDLNKPHQRSLKLQLIADDDAGKIEDRHHYQLKNLFSKLGADIPEEDFGCLSKLQKSVDSETAQIIDLIMTSYPQSLGPWCVVESFAHDWMECLMNSLKVHFPTIHREPYFEHCLNQNIETKHSEQAVLLTQEVLREYPDKLNITVQGARHMAVGLNDFWQSLEIFLERFEPEVQ